MSNAYKAMRYMSLEETLGFVVAWIFLVSVVCLLMLYGLVATKGSLAVVII